MRKGFVIAGERSGVGKTILTLVLAQAITNRGHKVQCFKVGPDFIDPGYHSAVTGRTSRNIDGWMMGKNACLLSFENLSQDVDVAVVEGVMGLFDGYDGKSEEGSTAQIAKWLHLPVVLVVDGSSIARTAGALVLGCEQYDPEVEIAGVIFNKVAGRRHYEYLKDGVRGKCRADVLGYIPRSIDWQIPGRHLGLVMAYEHDGLKESIDALTPQLEKTVAVDRILELCRKGRPRAGDSADDKDAAYPAKEASVGLACDEAFCFYYQDNIDLLKHYGAEITFFSPLHDENLPEGLSGLYLGGGYPELYAAALNKNKKMRDDILLFCRSGKPVYAECGGFLYLLKTINDQEGNRYEMAGLFPAEASIRSRIKQLGYVEVEAAKGCPFLAEGEKIRGHEFHYSDMSEMPRDVDRCYRVSRKRGRESFLEGYCTGNVLAGYMHLHFASNPYFAKNFVDKCKKKSSGG